MIAYAIGIRPLLKKIKPDIDEKKMKQAAYADDLPGGSTLEMLRDWWSKCVQYGPLYGYNPKPEKSWLVVKPDKLEQAVSMFEGSGVRITDVGKKYLGGFVGTIGGKIEYVDELLQEWTHELQELCKIAKSEPQSAYTCFTGGFKHKLTYFMRTIPDLENVLSPLDVIVENEFIPAITEGHHCSQDERLLLSLPVRLGGLGIPIFSDLCEREYRTSQGSTKQLVDNIINQAEERLIDTAKQKETESKLRKEKADYEKNLLEDLRSRMCKEKLRGNDLAQQKGASAWLNALPIKEEGYSLTKREFFDAISLRYRLPIKRLPTNCDCSKKVKFEPDHAMNCLTGGFIHKRHDGVRDILAQFLDQVSYDVSIEPPLQPLSGEVLTSPGANTDDEARADISARSFYEKDAMAFFDVRIFNPFAKTYFNVNLDQAYKMNERAKKNE